MTESEIQRHCFAVLVANEPGVLARVVGLFSGRGYNIESLTVDEVDDDGHLSRITIVTNGTRTTIDQIAAQLGRLIPVRQVVNLTEQGRFVESCLAFIKLIADESAHVTAQTIAARYGAQRVDTTDTAIIFALAAERDRTDACTSELQKLGTVEVARTGSLAMACGVSVLGGTHQASSAA